MAITYSDLTYHLDRDRWKVSGKCAFTEGTGTVAPADLGLDTVDEFRAQPSSGYVFQHDPATGIVLAMFGNYDDTGDSVLINDTSATPSDVPFEAVGV
jgi:hypothetical protein